METLDLHLAAAKRDNAAAAQYQQTARSTLSVRERWRVALVFGKVAKGGHLSAGDSKIWGVVSKNLREQDGEVICIDESGDMAGSSKINDSELSTQRLHSLAAQRRRRSSPLRGQQKGSLSPRHLTPREAVAQHVQSITPRSYTVSVSPRHEGHAHIVRADGITQSLEQSLGSVQGASLDTRNKWYLAATTTAAGVAEDNGQDECGDFASHMDASSRSRTISARSPRRGSSREISPRNSSTQFGDSAGDASTRSAGSSRSGSTLPYSGRSMRAHSPISRIPSQDADDAPPAMKRRLTKEPAPPPNACELANQQLLAARMLKSLAAVGAAIRTSIRASFSNDRSKVYVEAAAAAVAAVNGAEDLAVDFRTVQKSAALTPKSLSAHAGDGPSMSVSLTGGTASSSSLAVDSPKGAFSGAGFLGVDVIRSMVRRAKVSFD
jgi:hypothetical protein